MVAAIVGVASLAVGAYGASQQSKAAKNAANAQTTADQAAIAEQQREFDINQTNQAPWLKTGTSAENALASLYGLDGSSTSGGTAGGNGAPPLPNEAGGVQGGSQSSLGYNQFLNSPNYQWALQQGMGNLDKSAAARGNLYSGGYGQDLVDYNQGMASQQFNNYASQLSALASGGQYSAQNLGAAGQNMANQIGGYQQNIGQANASGYIGQANAWNGFANQLGQFGGTLAGSLSQPSYGSQTGSFNSLTGTGTYTGPDAWNSGSSFYDGSGQSALAGLGS